MNFKNDYDIYTLVEELVLKEGYPDDPHLERWTKFFIRDSIFSILERFGLEPYHFNINETDDCELIKYKGESSGEGDICELKGFLLKLRYNKRINGGVKVDEFETEEEFCQEMFKHFREDVKYLMTIHISSGILSADNCLDVKVGVKKMLN